MTGIGFVSDRTGRFIRWRWRWRGRWRPRRVVRIIGRLCSAATARGFWGWIVNYPGTVCQWAVDQGSTPVNTARRSRNHSLSSMKWRRGGAFHVNRWSSPSPRSSPLLRPPANRRAGRGERKIKCLHDSLSHLLECGPWYYEWNLLADVQPRQSTAFRIRSAFDDSVIFIPVCSSSFQHSGFDMNPGPVLACHGERSLNRIARRAARHEPAVRRQQPGPEENRPGHSAA